MRVYALAAVVGFFYLYLGSFAVETGASSYTDWAEAIASGTSVYGDSALYWRDIGMPIILVVSGYPFTHSLIGVEIIQFLMALAIPALLYLTIRPWFPRAAFYGALASILWLGPFLLFKTIQHDEPYLFFMMLGVCLGNRFFATYRATPLYAASVSIFASSVIRLIGKSVFPVIALAGALQKPRRKKAYLHLVVSVVFFYLCVTGYTMYRAAILGNPPSILGEQVFYDMYVNGNDFGVHLSPDYGPAVKKVLSRVKSSLNGGSFSKYIPDSPPYDREFFLKYTPAELFERMIDQPTFDYYYYIIGAARDDNLLLAASVETARAQPLYVLRYAARNFWELLADPGWLHGRFSTAPQIRGGLLFPFGGVTTAGRGTVGDRLPQPALNEASFVPLARQPELVRDLYARIELTWAHRYHLVTEVLLAGILVAWFATVVGLLERFSGRLSKLAYFLLADRVLDGSIAISGVLVVNVAMSAVLVEPYYRYDYSLICLKVLLATIGFAVVLSVASKGLTGLKRYVS